MSFIIIYFAVFEYNTLVGILYNIISIAENGYHDNIIHYCYFDYLPTVILSDNKNNYYEVHVIILSLNIILLWYKRTPARAPTTTKASLKVVPMTNETSEDDDDRPEPCARRGARAARPAETASGAERDIIILLYFTTAERLYGQEYKYNNNNVTYYYTRYIHTASYEIIILYHFIL